MKRALKIRTQIAVFAFALIALSACKNSTSTGTFKDDVAGKAGEVIVVMSPGKWESIPGDTVRSVLNTPEVALPRIEPKFDLIFIPTDGFGALYRNQRNILLARIGPDFQEKKIRIQKDSYAKSQLIITVKAPSDTAFANLMHENRDKIINLIQDTERLRLMSTYKKHQDAEIHNMLKNEHGINLTIPKGYDVNINEQGFVWLVNDHRAIIENIVIYYYNYTDKKTFTKDFLIDKRDTYLKKIPGEVEGSFVTTETRAPIFEQTFNLHNKYTFQMRGLWRVQDGLAMGGPFISISQYDRERNRIVTVEGFIFAPSEGKRDYIRRAEAILYSTKYAKEQAISE